MTSVKSELDAAPAEVRGVIQGLKGAGFVAAEEEYSAASFGNLFRVYRSPGLAVRIVRDRLDWRLDLDRGDAPAVQGSIGWPSVWVVWRKRFTGAPKEAQLELESQFLLGHLDELASAVTEMHPLKR